MSLDATKSKIISTGQVTITADGIDVSGFECEGCTCRDLAVLSCVWAIGELQRELNGMIEEPGGGNVAIGGE